MKRLFVFFTLIISILSFQIISCGSAENSNTGEDPQTNQNLLDSDGDTILDSEDLCPHVKNAKVSVSVDAYFHDGIVDECTDTDGDGIADGIDNCPTVPNPDQKDSNHNGVGDACAELDTDHDGVKDDEDACPYTCTITSLPHTFVDADGSTEIINVCPQVLNKIDSDDNNISDNEPILIRTCPIF